MHGAFFKKAVLGLLIALFLAVSMGGIFTAGMMDDGVMNNCPFMNVPALCAMSPLEHLSQWEEMFAATAQHLAATALLLLLALVICWYSLQDFILQKAKVPIPERQNTGRFFDPLRLAFARGILHSKAY